MGIVQSSWAIGYALAAIVAGAILARASWRWVFFVGVLPALLVFWIQHDVPEPQIWQLQQRGRGAGRTQKAGLWRAALPHLIALIAMNTFGMFAWWGLFTWIPAYLGLPLSEGGRGFRMFDVTTFLVALNLIGMLPGYLLFGVFADWRGRKRVLIFYLVAAAVFVPVFAAARQPVSIMLAACLSAFFGTGFFTGSAIIGSELFPTPIRATALGISYNLARGLSALAPLLIGTVGQARGLSWGFAICGGAFWLAAASALWIPETRGVELT